MSRDYLKQNNELQLFRHWAWDGRNSTCINYDPLQAGVAVNASIKPGRPDSSLLISAAMREVMHMSIRWVDRSLADILDSPSSHWVEAVEVNGKLLPTVSSTVDGAGGNTLQVICTFDPKLDWFPVLISINIVQSTPATKTSAEWSMLESALAPIPGIDRHLHYAKRSSLRIETDAQESNGVSYIDVTALRINPPASNDLFSVEIPSGTRVFDYSKSSGKRSSEYIAGGPAAEQERSAKIVRAIEAERQRVITQGNIIDASIPQGGGGFPGGYWCSVF